MNVIHTSLNIWEAYIQILLEMLYLIFWLYCSLNLNLSKYHDKGMFSFIAQINKNKKKTNKKIKSH